MAARPSKTGVRAAHGNARNGGRLTVLERLPMDELPKPPASPPDTVPSQRDAAGRFLPGNSTARMAKVRAGKSGALSLLECKADPAWLALNRWGRRYASNRIAELSDQFGALSSGVCGMVVTAGNGLADSAYLRARGAELGDPKLIVAAASLAKDARQAERDAYALAALEASTKPQRSARERLEASMAKNREPLL
ncbi:MAG: hypothetical protein ABI548_01665 [Polyangiaceae bacterium]